MKQFNLKKKKLTAIMLISTLLFAISVPAYAGYHQDCCGANGESIWTCLNVNWLKKPDFAHAWSEYDDGSNQINNTHLYVLLQIDTGNGWKTYGTDYGTRRDAKVKCSKDVDAFKSLHRIVYADNHSRIYTHLNTYSDRW